MVKRNWRSLLTYVAFYIINCIRVFKINTIKINFTVYNLELIQVNIIIHSLDMSIVFVVPKEGRSNNEYNRKSI